jgi:hypothetical protein
VNQEFKQKWVNALRSGNYKQCKYKLHNEEGFCCLGVALDVGDFKGRWVPRQLEAGFQGSQERYVELFYYWQSENEFNEGVIPASVREEIGLSWETHQRLSAMNDHNGYSFDEIADFIERRL